MLSRVLSEFWQCVCTQRTVHGLSHHTMCEQETLEFAKRINQIDLWLRNKACGKFLNLSNPSQIYAYCFWNFCEVFVNHRGTPHLFRELPTRKWRRLYCWSFSSEHRQVRRICSYETRVELKESAGMASMLCK